MDTLEKEELKQRRMNRIEILKNTWKKKMEAKKLRAMLQMLRSLSLEELEMDIDEIQMRAEEMMEVVESHNMEEQMELEDSCTMDDDGDNVNVMEQFVSVMGLESEAGVNRKFTSKGGECQNEDKNTNIKYSFSIQDQNPTTIYLGGDLENKSFGEKINFKRKRESSETRNHKKWRGFGASF